MSDLKEILIAMIWALSDAKRVSLPRLVKAMYLYDWTSVLNFGAQSPALPWSCGMCGPTSSRINETIRVNADSFSVCEASNHVGGRKTMVVCNALNTYSCLSEAEQRAIRHVADAIRGMPWDDLSLLISSTMPVVISTYGEPLDLVRAAQLRRAANGRDESR